MWSYGHIVFNSIKCLKMLKSHCASSDCKSKTENVLNGKHVRDK